MSMGNDNSYSNYPGSGDGYGQQPHGFGQASEGYGQQADEYVDPYAVPTEANDPYAIDPYAGDPQRDAAMPPPWAQAGTATAGPQGVPPQFGAYQPSMPTSGAGLTGFIVGLVSLVLCGGFASIAGIFFSIMGMQETGAKAHPPMGGRGLAIAGLVLNIVGLVMLLGWVIYIVFVIVLMFVAAMAGA